MLKLSTSIALLALLVAAGTAQASTSNPPPPRMLPFCENPAIACAPAVRAAPVAVPKTEVGDLPCKYWNPNNAEYEKEDVGICESALLTRAGDKAMRSRAAIDLARYYMVQSILVPNAKQKALDWLTFADRENPTDTEALFASALIQTSLGVNGFDELKAFEHLVRLAPTDWRGHYGVVTALCRRGKHEEALKAAAVLARVAPEHPLALVAIGRVHELLGDEPTAMAHYAKASHFQTPENYTLPVLEQETSPFELWANLALKLEGGKRAANILSELMNRNEPSHEWFIKRASYFAAANMFAEAAADIQSAREEQGFTSEDELVRQREAYLRNVKKVIKASAE